MSGAERIAEAFAAGARRRPRAALMPYLMGGFPDLETSRRVGLAYAEAGPTWSSSESRSPTRWPTVR